MPKKRNSKVELHCFLDNMRKDKADENAKIYATSVAEKPATPVHVQGDSNIDINRVGELSQSEIDDFDLNIGGDFDDGILTSEKTPTKRSVPEDETIADDFDDYAPRVNISSPFSSQTTLSETQFHRSKEARRLSEAQQSRFISYVDAQILAIQRKYVQSRGLNVSNGYTGLQPLLSDLKSLIDFIWYSMTGRSKTDGLLKKESSDELVQNWSEKLFGQNFYLLKIADDLIDFMERFDLKGKSTEEQNDTLSKLFKLLMILDKIFSKMIDSNTQHHKAMNGTDMVRLMGIAERTRVKLPSYLESQGIQGYHYEVSKIYENSLERCGA